jgi:DNA gyrase subunit B
MADNINTQNYDENQIQILEGLEAVRKRPGMYIGTTSIRGLHHLVYEIVDNSIDEALAGACSEIKVVLYKDGSCSVEDNGRGIPSAINPKTGTPTPEVVYTVLHAGGKFGGEGYQISGGLHGVGASVVNALSEWLYYEDRYNGEAFTERFSRGNVTESFKKIGQTEKHGLFVRFLPDKEIFDETVFEYQTLLNRLREQAFLNAGIKIVLRDEREDEPIENELYYEGGVMSFVSHLNSIKHCDLVNKEVIYIKATSGTSSLEVALQYNDTYSETLMTFANNINTVE